MEIPILNIDEFEKEEPLNNFYSNSFRKHIIANKDFFFINLIAMISISV